MVSVLPKPSVQQYAAKNQTQKYHASQSPGGIVWVNFVGGWHLFIDNQHLLGVLYWNAFSSVVLQPLRVIGWVTLWLIEMLALSLWQGRWNHRLKDKNLHLISCKYPFNINVTRRFLAENYSLSLHVVKKIMSLLYRRTELGGVYTRNSHRCQFKIGMTTKFRTAFTWWLPDFISRFCKGTF